MQRKLWRNSMLGGALAALLLAGSVAGFAAEPSYRKAVEGVVVYYGIMPAELIRSHITEHPERAMHGGARAGENHLVVAVFDEKTGRRLTAAEVRAHISGPGGLDVRKPLEPMTLADTVSYGNYFYMPGTGPYRIEIEMTVPGKTRPVRAVFDWARP